MTATAAARAAADPRPTRARVGRRAVQVALFLGGLLALGLLAGGRAEAQERTGPGRLTASVADAVPKDAAPEAAARTEVEPFAQRVAEPVSDEVVEPIADLVDRPAEQKDARQQVAQQQSAQKAAAEPQAERATDHADITDIAEPSDITDIADVTDPTAPAEALAAVPAPEVAAAPARVRAAVDRIAGEVRPLVPSLPGLPPLLSVLPVPDGAPDVPGAPSPSVPDAGGGAESGTATPGASAERADGHDRSTGAASSVAPAVPDSSGTPHAGPAQSAAPTPAQDRAPFDPCGDLVRTAVADAQGPRGGDLHATPAPGGPYTALVRGAGLPGTVAPIPDRSGEILEFPG
ncbi:hypothetical protein ACFWM7_14225 [Streptomyces sp. NPDC058375]|uniref:hypothetical protein n=1 Tax=Streptomyces sp. NPDC058375 TaxID=3346467 RepID=UPI0036676014